MYRVLIGNKELCGNGDHHDRNSISLEEMAPWKFVA